MTRKGAEEARSQLPHLLDEAEQGRSTVITRRGQPIAALVPFGKLAALAEQEPLTPLAGSGRNLWGADSRDTIGALRDEWSR